MLHNRGQQTDYGLRDRNPETSRLCHEMDICWGKAALFYHVLTCLENTSKLVLIDSNWAEVYSRDMGVLEGDVEGESAEQTLSEPDTV